MTQLQLVMEVCNLETTDFIQFWPMHDNLLYVTRVERDREWFANALPVFRHFTKILRELRADPSVLEGKSVEAAAVMIKGMLATPRHEWFFEHLLEPDDDGHGAPLDMEEQTTGEVGGVPVSLEDWHVAFGYIDYNATLEGSNLAVE